MKLFKWIIIHERSVLLVTGAIAVFALFLWLIHPRKTPVGESPPPGVSNIVQGSESALIVKSDSSVIVVGAKRTVRVVIPPHTTIGDSALVVEVTSAETTAVERHEATTVKKQKQPTARNPIPVQTTKPEAPVKERIFGICAGIGGNAMTLRPILTVGIAARLYRPVHLIGGACVDNRGELSGFAGLGYRIGRLFGFKLLAGAGITHRQQALVTISLL